MDGSIRSKFVIKGNDEGPAVKFSGDESSSCTLTGFCIEDGSADCGGGVCGNGTLATISYNDIYGNYAREGGGMWRCNGLVSNNTITLNSSDGCGGAMYKCHGLIKNNTISENQCHEDGGGLCYCNGTIRNNIISDNNSSYGGDGGGLYECNGLIMNNLISRNANCGLYKCNGPLINNTIAFNGGPNGLWRCYGIIANCIIWGDSSSTYWLNTTPVWSCIQDWDRGGTHNITTNPGFVNPENNDYHLSSDSLCIDAGNTYYLYGEHIADMDNECRIAGGLVDIGADEYGSVQDSDGDLLSNADESVWGSNPDLRDTDNDGLIDSAEIFRGSEPTVSNVPAVINIPSDYSSIQEAVFKSFPHEEIIIHTGSYHENIHIPGKNLVLRGTDPEDEAVVDATIINGESLNAVITFTGVENETSILKGLTLTNGSAGYGGGISCNGAGVMIENNKITTNTSVISGGGIYHCEGRISENIVDGNYTEGGGAGLSDCSGLIENNIISNNKSEEYGGGLYNCNGIIQKNVIKHNVTEGFIGGGLSECHGEIKYNEISNNASYWGGGVAKCNATISFNSLFNNYAFYGGGAFYKCNNWIENNTIKDNNADLYGGGFCRCNGIIKNNIVSENCGGGFYECHGLLQNNTVVMNYADRQGAGLAHCDGYIVNCIIWGNVADGNILGEQLALCNTPHWCCIEDWEGGGRNNISSNPRFVNPSESDYRLLPDSFCIDSGYTFYTYGDYIGDVDGDCRISGDSVDIGAQEFAALPDSDGDMMSDQDEIDWGSNPNLRDTDGDGLIDGVEIIRGADPVEFDIPTGINVPSDYPDVQEALFKAFPHESITVQPGTYVENLHFLGKNVLLRSTEPQDAGIVESTVIDGGAWYSTVRFSGEEEEPCVIEGCRFTNGSAISGGAISGNGCKASIKNNIIDSNVAAERGGGVFDCDGRIFNNRIEENSSDVGGGLADCDDWIKGNNITTNTAQYGAGLFGCNGLIQNNDIGFNLNEATDDTGGLLECNGTIDHNRIFSNTKAGIAECQGMIKNNRIFNNEGSGICRCDGTIKNNIISGNSALNGGGLFDCNGDILNNTIVGNSATEYGGGIHFSSGNVRNCIIWGNNAPEYPQYYEPFGRWAPAYSCIQNYSDLGTGIITDDPQFVDPENGDYHLKPTSPCIDAGGEVQGVSEDFEGDLRPFDFSGAAGGDGSNFDIGVDEVSPPLKHFILGKANMTPEQRNDADVNGDGIIDVADIVSIIRNASP